MSMAEEEMDVSSISDIPGAIQKSDYAKKAP
jgi:hypothetical protein